MTGRVPGASHPNPHGASRSVHKSRAPRVTKRGAEDQNSQGGGPELTA